MKSIPTQLCNCATCISAFNDAGKLLYAWESIPENKDKCILYLLQVIISAVHIIELQISTEHGEDASSQFGKIDVIMKEVVYKSTMAALMNGQTCGDTIRDDQLLSTLEKHLNHWNAGFDLMSMMGSNKDTEH